MRRFVATALATAEEPSSVETIFYIDNDDHESLLAAHGMQGEGYPVLYMYCPRIVLSECWNEIYLLGEGPIYGHMGDDVCFRSQGWDTLVTQAFEQYPDGIAFVYGRDGLQDKRLGTHGFLHKDWVEAVGHFCPPYFSHDYNDTWLNEVAEELGRRVYLPGVFIEHLHPDAGKAKIDQTYLDHAEAGRRDNVDALYASLRPQRIEDVEKLRAVMGVPV